MRSLLYFRFSLFPALALLATVTSASGQESSAAGGTATDVLNRIFSFDSNRDDRITSDELPERMQDLVRLHDQNGDGALVRIEVQNAMDRAVLPVRATSFLPLPVKNVTMADVIRDLRLPRAKRDRALALTRDRLAWLINRKPKTIDKISARLRQLLDTEEYDNFVAAVARIRTITVITVS